MDSHTTERFRKAFNQLPPEIQRSAKHAFNLWKENPDHPSLRFKQIHTTEFIFSVRVGLHYRALGVKEGDTMIWSWIGSHAEYDLLIERL